MERQISRKKRSSLLEGAQGKSDRIALLAFNAIMPYAP